MMTNIQTLQNLLYPDYIYIKLLLQQSNYRWQDLLGV